MENSIKEIFDKFMEESEQAMLDDMAKYDKTYQAGKKEFEKMLYDFNNCMGLIEYDADKQRIKKQFDEVYDWWLATMKYQRSKAYIRGYKDCVSLLRLLGILS